MAKFKNTSPLGALEIPALGITVERDAEFEVEADMAFAVAAGGFEAVDAAAKTAAAELAAFEAEQTEQEQPGPRRRQRPEAQEPEQATPPAETTTGDEPAETNGEAA